MRHTIGHGLRKNPLVSSEVHARHPNAIHWCCSHEQNPISSMHSTPKIKHGNHLRILSMLNRPPKSHWKNTANTSICSIFVVLQLVLDLSIYFCANLWCSMLVMNGKNFSTNHSSHGCTMCRYQKIPARTSSSD